MYKKHIIGLLIGLMVWVNCFSQVELGGTIGFGITNNCMTIDLNPEAALALGTNKNFKLGFSPFFMYNKTIGNSYWTAMYGTREFVEFHFNFNIFLHGELESAKIVDSEGNKASLLALPLGLGGTTHISEKLDAYFMVLYDFLYDESWAVRSNPQFRAGVRYRL